MRAWPGWECVRVVALRGPGWPGSCPACRPAGSGFRTTCWLAGASPWRGSKEASAIKVLELGVPATVIPAGKRKGVFRWRQ